MAYDEAGGQVVLFGGTSDAGRFGDTWLYDPAGNAWSEVAGAGAPEARSAGAMVYLDDAETVLLFGGVGEAGRFADTWTFTSVSGSGAWTALEPAGSIPSARSGHAMAYDYIAGAVVLFGGYDGSGLLNDTWAYDPAANTWTELAPTGDAPSARGNHRMVFDASAGRVVLFGGFDGTAELADTWAYDIASNTWTEVQTTGSVPAGREQHALVYDPHAGRVLLFGGFDETDTDLNDLWALTLTP
jgi:N-acetylneuraminic acid mutarotase